MVINQTRCKPTKTGEVSHVGMVVILILPTIHKPKCDKATNNYYFTCLLMNHFLREKANLQSVKSAFICKSVQNVYPIMYSKILRFLTLCEYHPLSEQNQFKPS